LHEVRTGNGFGPNPIGFRELRDWMEVTGNKPETWELRALRRLDREYISSQVKKGTSDD
jgi:hypothetical protein